MSDEALPMPYLRADLADFAGYSSARTSGPAPQVEGEAEGATTPAERVWLNANESAVANPGDPDGSSRRYPDPQPAELRERLAALWGVRPEELLVTRGSDEAIDLLVRGCCPPGRGSVVVTPPTFGMYGVVARLHGAETVAVPQVVREVAVEPGDPSAGPLAEEDGSSRREHWAVDVDEVLAAAERSRADLVFLASPGNPTGQTVPTEELARVAEALRGRALLVVDEAYADFTGRDSASVLLAEHESVVVLRTLSKAHGLAGARIGAVLGRAPLVTALGRVQAPYPLAVPAVRLALEATSPEAVRRTTEQVQRTVVERERVAAALAATAGREGHLGPTIRAVLAGEANFVTLRCEDPEAVLQELEGTGVVVRSLARHPGLRDGVRITVGTPEQNDRVLRVLAPDAALAAPAPSDPTTPQEAL
ncbi:aminotransferase class I/II-fold pyridoxal phosphate-dependent enzyme [Kytococcus sp. Marseille-QA3725]